MPNQQCQSTEGNRMFICWFTNTSWKYRYRHQSLHSLKWCYLSTAFTQCKPKSKTNSQCTRKLSSIEDWVPTDSTSNWDPNPNFDLQSQESKNPDPSIHMQKIKVKGHLVQKLEWKRMYRRMDGGDCITSRANGIGKKSVDVCALLLYMLSYIIQHRTVLTIFPLILQTIIIAQMLSSGIDDTELHSTKHFTWTNLPLSACSWTFTTSNGLMIIASVIPAKNPANVKVCKTNIQNIRPVFGTKPVGLCHYLYHSNSAPVFPIPTTVL